MNKEEFSSQLRSFYAKIKRQVSLGESEFVLENIFGIENIKSLVNEQFEEVYQNFFVTKKIDIEKRKLFSYADIYDFINTLFGIDPDDLIIFFTYNEILEFTLSLINILNKSLNNWVQNRKSGFRKGTKIFLEIDQDGIHLYLKPEIKT